MNDMYTIIQNKISFTLRTEPLFFISFSFESKKILLQLSAVTAGGAVAKG